MSSRTRSTPVKSELASTIAEIQKEKGTSYIRPASQLAPFNRIPVGPFTLDYALGGGIPEGLPALFYGSHSGGKTTLCHSLCASAQRKYPDQTVAFIDPETSYDAQWAKTHGVDIDRLQLVQPVTGEEGVDILIALMETREISLIVVDSIPSLVPMKITELSAEDATVGKLPQLMGRMCSLIVSSTMKERKRGHWVTVVLTNQWRSKIGFVLGDPRTLPGGHQIMHLATTHVEVKNKEVIDKETKSVTTNEHSFRITKSKGASIRSGEFQMVIDPMSHGLPVGTLMDAPVVATYARKIGMITGAGSSWKIAGVKEKFGKLEEITAFLYSEPDFYLRMKRAIIMKQREERGLPPLPPDGYLLGSPEEDNSEIES